MNFLMNVGWCRSENGSELVGCDRQKGMKQDMAWTNFYEEVTKLFWGLLPMVGWKQRRMK